MLTYNVHLQKSERVAEGTMAFYFERPPGFEFTAGQFLTFTLIDPPRTDEKGNTRNFTIASAPYQDHLMITTRIRESALKQTLRGSAPGTEVEIEGPGGSFTLRDGAPAVFIAGGIGITPFLSILRQAAHDGLAQNLMLFYSNRRPQDAAFLGELQALEAKLPNFRFVPTMTQPEGAWAGETGRIDPAMLKRQVSDVSAPVVYLAGPPDMVNALREMLAQMGIGRQNVRAEQFGGY